MQLLLETLGNTQTKPGKEESLKGSWGMTELSIKMCLCVFNVGQCQSVCVDMCVFHGGHKGQY